MTRIIKTTGLVLFLMIGNIVLGQTTFSYNDDFKKILAQTKDENDNLFYDKLLKRYLVNDTTLTDFEVLALLIGFTDKPAFKPYADLRIERKIYDINENEKFKEALDSATLFLQTHPFSVKVLFEKSYSFHKLGQEDSAAVYAYRAYKIFQAMYFSGNGTTLDRPTFALGPADGQDYIRKYIRLKIGTMGSTRDKNGNFIDVLEAVSEDGSASVKLYFIIQHATNKMFSEGELKALENVDKKKKKKKKK